MKRLMFLVLALAAVQLSSGQSEPGPFLTWEKSSHDFGDIPQGEKIEHTFRFSNTGTQPLIITNVSTQCGCTAPRGWPRDPIAPGDHGEITLVFDSSGKFGRVNKVATVISNASNKDGGQVLLSGNIHDKKVGNQ
ncbi:MAG TPA: DUF1573 domain-containing protein [Cyclobacteriaceae bacterium]|nr:DUF1573 domain-containing protein [Cyclobacteriaceae bacterium]